MAQYDQHKSQKESDLFNGELEDLDKALVNTRISKVRLNYSTLLLNTPCSSDELLDIWAIAFRKIIGELLIDLYEKKQEAEFYLTCWRFEKDRVLICSFAQIHPDNLRVWSEQIINGAACFDKRILDDCLKKLANIRKNSPPIKSEMIEDWEKENFNKCQLSFDW